MMTSQTAFRGTVLAAVQQLGLVTLLFLLLVVWLQIPDANAFEVLLSLLFAVLFAAAAGTGESLIALRLTGRAITARRLFVGAVAVLVAALLWYAVFVALQKLSGNTFLYAGYLNSRVPASMRNVFSYGHIANWLEWFSRALRWLVAALLAALAFSFAVCQAPGRGLRAILRSPCYWLACMLLFLAGGVLTGSLMGWTPGHGLSLEAVSLAVRLLLAIALNALAAGFLMWAMAAAVLRLQAGGGVTPDTSQPRTADMP